MARQWPLIRAGETGSLKRIHVVLAIGAALTTLAFSYVAHIHGRPVTAALLAVVAVTMVGAVLGLRAGVLAGVGASIIYNLVISDPYLQFSLASIDDFVPLVALNISAIASGLIAGRLHDRAVAAERSRERVAELLEFSQALQRAVTMPQIEETVRNFLGAPTDTVTVCLTKVPPETDVSAGHAGRYTARTFRLGAAEGASAYLIVRDSAGSINEARVEALLPILTIAVHRCVLAGEAAEAELLRRSESFKTALLSSVSHDLRTPLAAIAASASSLASSRNELSEDTQDDLLQTIQEQCARLDRLTGNLLNLGRIDGGLDVQRMPLVDALDVLGSSLSRVRRVADQHRLERHFNVTSAMVRADEPLLEQLFFNVLENAVVHTPAGTLIVINAATCNGALVVSIRDDGPGIADGDRDRIFERFFQITRERQRGVGAGLGLSISKSFVEAIGGTIAATSPTSKPYGARIDIEIPLARGSA